MIKRLKKEYKNLMREVKKSVKRKLVSESEEDDSDTAESSMDDRSPKRKRETENEDTEAEDDNDKTMLVESTSAGQSSTNNNSDVLVDIDCFCESGDETQPIHAQRENWMKMASKLTREEKQSFSAELRLLSLGVKGWKNSILYFQIPGSTEDLGTATTAEDNHRD